MRDLNTHLISKRRPMFLQGFSEGVIRLEGKGVRNEFTHRVIGHVSVALLC